MPGLVNLQGCKGNQQTEEGIDKDGGNNNRGNVNVSEGSNVPHACPSISLLHLI